MLLSFIIFQYSLNNRSALAFMLLYPMPLFDSSAKRVILLIYSQ
jgi:hypothetical protein